MRILTIAALLMGGTMLSLPALTDAARAQNRPGKVAGGAKANINKPNVNRASYGGGNVNAGNRARPNSRNYNNGYNNRPNYNNRPGRNPDVVVINNGRPGNGYYNNGNYYGGNRYDDNDDDFLEFVGKTAAVTAGVSVVSAVIGSVVKDKPSGDCQQQVQNGQVYMLCNGVWYTPVQAGGQTNYQVVAPPAN